MKKHLKFIDSTADKFWQIETADLTFTVTYGKNGTSGTTQTKAFDSAEVCLKMAEKLIAEKVKKGYSDNGQVVLNKVMSDKKADLQAILDKFDTIRDKGRIDDLLPFLQEHTKGHTEGLKKHFKKCRRDPNYQWWNGINDLNHRILTLSAIALFDKTDITTWDEVFRLLEDLRDPLILDILKWAKPNWLDTFLLDKIKNQRWTSYSYRNLRILEERQLIAYNPELFALCLANYGYHNYLHRNQEINSNIQLLTADDIAYQRDILELFNYETDLHLHTYRSAENDKLEVLSTWGIVFTQLLAENKLDRTFFIEQCLQIQTKEWNNNLKSFFRKTLDELTLSNDELIPFQETIFSFFHAVYPPIVGYGVEKVKQIYLNPAFNTLSFLEWVAPIMMRSDCKGAIKTLLSMFEKMNKATPPDGLGTSPYKNQISSVIADIFVISDMSLQEKAAKTLLKIADVNDTNLKEKLTLYAPQMQGTIKTQLAVFLEKDDNFDADTEGYATYEFAPKKAQLLTKSVVLPKDWNEILFQFGTFIPSNEVLDAEILLNTFITQRHLFPKDFKEQLQPYFKQLEHTYFNCFYKNVLKGFLMQKMEQLKKPFVHNLLSSNSSQIKTLDLFLSLVAKVDNKIRIDSNLPLLSMPTHAPYWIHPKTLVERLIAYQKSKETIDLVDFSIAISRMVRENTEEVRPLLAQLDPDMAQLMAFCLGFSREINFKDTQSIVSKAVSFIGGNVQKLEYIPLWAVAARTAYPQETFKEFEHTYLIDVPFVVSPFKPKCSFLEQWNDYKNYQTGKMERSPSWYELYVESPKAQKIPNYLLYSLNVFMEGRSWEFQLHSEDNVFYWHSIMPQNPEALAYNLARTVCRMSSNSSNELKGYLTVVNRPEFWFSDLTLLVFACCFFQEKKDIRFMATEVLINVIEKQTLNAEQLGEKLAFLISGKYGVLLRFIDSLCAIKDVSSLHNSALFLILDSLFKHLIIGDKLPTNFKKLVEHYADVSHKTQHKPSLETLIFFEKYAENAALKGVIKQIN